MTVASTDYARVISSELAFVLEHEDVVAELEDKLLELGVNTIAMFAALVESPAGMRDLAKSGFDMDSKAGGMEMEAKVSSILVAWTTSRKRGQASRVGRRAGRKQRA